VEPASEANVIIAGAGPVGLTMAVSLARQGVRCRVLDQNPQPVAESRALAVHARTLEIFDDLGVIEPVLSAGHRIHGANLYAEGRRILHFSFDELASPYPFAVDLPQSQTERILAARLRDLGIELERPVAVTGLHQGPAGVTVFARLADGQIVTLRASYVIGCDGAHSTVRHASGLRFDGESLDESFLLADAPVEWDAADDEWYLWFHEDGLFTLFPLGGGVFRIMADTSRDVPPDSAALRSIFNERGPRSARLGDPAWISAFHISHRKAASYQRGRIFIAGDAAHVQSPAGGQGMNTGIQDAYNLAWKLGMVLRGNAPESLLESYTAEREPVARSVLALTENLTSIATLRHPIPQKIRNRLIPILAGFEVLEQRLLSRLAEISISYRRSPIVGQSGRWYTAAALPGDRALDAPLGGGRRVFDLLRGARHVVLMFTSEHPGEEDLRGFENIERYMRGGYSAEVTSYLISRSDLPWPGPLVMDADGAAHHTYSAGVPCLYLIRPDGYIGFRSLGSDPLPLLEYLNRVYEPPMEDVALPAM
jgi:2-polyprenyl-6-methoxyphenol hydroxylase-like FAD-dependent oxidoreductase